MDRLDDSERLLSLLPPIRRARLWRLYAQDGRRFLDFWMDGGRDILGAKGTGLGTALKAAVDLGTARPLPSVWKARLAKQVAELWPGYAALRLYLNEERALAALGREMGTRAAQDSAAADSAAQDSAAPVAVGDPNGGGLVFDPAERPAPRSPGTVLLLRPYAEALGAPGTGSRPGPEDAPEPRFAPRFAAALVRLPCPRVFSPAIALLRDGEAAARMSEDLVPPLVLAAASRSLWEFKRFAESYDEKLWRRVDRRLGPFFERSGPYLYPRHSAAEHEARFRAALEAGALISPIHALPSIVPGDFDDGELARLAAALAR
ncbi:MAG TPA: hypothetical protein VMV90_07560 [Rectinemataceae bacterium]|nr:hypothetical protein [Rectinemataceae bacterium]